MNPAEYRTMRDVEDVHWWYAGLRGMIQGAWKRWNRAEHPIVLDVGCGTGANMAMMREFGRVAGVDMSSEALAFCRERGIADVARGSLSQMAVSEASVDGILLMDVLYHRAVPDKAEALREVARVLKPGGLVLINVPAYQWLMSSHDAAIHTDKRFTSREVRRLLEDAGLVIERITYWNSLLFLPAALVRVLRKSSATGESDLSGYRESVATQMFRLALALERAILRLCPLPFGLSIFAVARKPG